MNKEISLDLDLTPEQFECLEIHGLFKSKGVYNELKHPDVINSFDQVVVYYNASYNDYMYDIKPIQLDLLKNNEIVKTIRDEFREFEYYKCFNGNDYKNQLSFLITKKMIF